MKYYVNMTDKFMSNWGNASGGKSYLSIECDTEDQANVILCHARRRPEMKRIEIAHAPRYGRRSDHTTIRTWAELGQGWKGLSK